ncbi:alkyl sulfatase C-terminal domain-containing protein [Nocardia testacea]|uniref:alkyl sulfatase C-terminal domain-containing protein n=1 Tax=Nocardia testacea TaxID=248551 RepID=UPI003A8AC78E
MRHGHRALCLDHATARGCHGSPVPGESPAPPRTARPCEPDGRRLSVAGPKRALTGVLPKPAAGGALAESGTVRLDGDRVALTEPAALLDEFDPSFPIVTP